MKATSSSNENKNNEADNIPRGVRVSVSNSKTNCKQSQGSPPTESLRTLFGSLDPKP